MRIALSVIASLLVTLQLLALPDVKTGALPGWLYSTHPDLHKAPSREDISSGIYYQLCDLQSNLTCNTEYAHFIRTIVNESGVQNGSEVSVTFAPQFQQVIFHHITIIRDGVPLDRLQLQNIKVVQEETDADEFQYNGQKRAFLILKDVRKGDQIDFAYSIVGFNPVFNNRYSDEFSFNMVTAVCNYYKTIITTANRPLHIQTTNKAPQPIQQHQGDKLIYTWENPPLNTDEPVSAAPSWYNPAPTVYVSEYASWQEVVDWGLNTFNHYHHPLPVSLQQKIAEWQNRSKGDKNIFAALATRFVQDEVRYLGLEIGANTHRPHPPGDVFTQRFGDCKDKALLLSTILQQDSIPAYAALISTDTRSRLAAVAPSPEAFDHVIVAIRQPAGTYTFIDPTISGQRGQLADLYVPAYGYSLVLRDGETTLQPVTPGKINDYSITETLEARFYDTSHFSVTSVYSGGAADNVRNFFAETSQKDLEQNYHKIYGTLFEDIRQEGRITYTEDSNKNTVTVTKHYAVPQLWNTNKDGKRYFDYTVKILEQNFSDPADAPANAPISMTYPFNVHYTLNLALPEDWELADEELHIRNDTYQFDYVPETHGSNMTLHFTFKTFRDNIPAADIRQYKEDYKKIAEKISFQIYKNITPDGPGREEAASAKSPLLPHKSYSACWPAIWLTFFFCLVFSRLFQYLNTRSEETLYSPGSGYPIGGWLIFLGISLGSSLLFELSSLFISNPYNGAVWTAYEKAGGKLLQYLFLSDLAIRLTYLAGSASLLYWFLKKRDIFPRMFLWYVNVLVAGRLLLLVLSYAAPTAEVFRSQMIMAFVRTVIYCLVWAAYIRRSSQVKSTFLEPFRERIR